MTAFRNVFAVRFREQQEPARDTAPGDRRDPAPRVPWREDAPDLPQGLCPAASIRLTLHTVMLLEGTRAHDYPWCCNRDCI